MKLSTEKPTYVYVMQAGDRTKIGIADDPMKRKRQVITATGLDIVLRSYRQFSTRLSALDVERRLHRHFGRHRLPGEWFAVPAERAVKAMQEIDDPNLHINGWAPGMPLEVASSPLERFRWHRAKRKGEPYVPSLTTP